MREKIDTGRDELLPKGHYTAFTWSRDNQNRLIVCIAGNRPVFDHQAALILRDELCHLLGLPATAEKRRREKGGE